MDGRRVVSGQLSPVVSAGLKDDNARSLRNHSIQSGQHASRGVAVDASIDDMDVETLRTKKRFQLCGIGLAARYTLAEGVAGSKGHNGCSVSSAKRGEHSERTEKKDPAKLCDHYCPPIGLNPNRMLITNYYF